jgi:hypothetical protein
MSVRIETDGRLTVFAGADKRPIATAGPTVGSPARSDPGSAGTPQSVLRAEFENLAGIMARIDAVGETGLDGHDLRELGLKNGNLVVDDRRNGKQWKFDGINVSLTRPRQGGVVFRLDPTIRNVLGVKCSDAPARGVRAVGIEARKSHARHLLALRLAQATSMSIFLCRRVFAPRFRRKAPRLVQGQVLADAGTLSITKTTS